MTASPLRGRQGVSGALATCRRLCARVVARCGARRTLRFEATLWASREAAPALAARLRHAAIILRALGAAARRSGRCRRDALRRYECVASHVCPFEVHSKVLPLSSTAVSRSVPATLTLPPLPGPWNWPLNS